MEVSQFFGLLPPSAWGDQRPYFKNFLKKKKKKKIYSATALRCAPGLRPGWGRPGETAPGSTHPPSDCLRRCPHRPPTCWARRRVAPTPTLRRRDGTCASCSRPRTRGWARSSAQRRRGSNRASRENRYLWRTRLDPPIEDGAVLEIGFEPKFPRRIDLVFSMWLNRIDEIHRAPRVTNDLTTRRRRRLFGHHIRHLAAGVGHRWMSAGRDAGGSIRRHGSPPSPRFQGIVARPSEPLRYNALDLSTTADIGGCS